jgi:hypothetical protein
VKMRIPSEFLSATETLDSPSASSGRLGKLARIALYAFVVLIACPIRYWPLESGVDETWRFALNYAAAQGSAAASETVFTMGPLNYLIFPQDIGGNLARGLLFQTVLWLVLATIFADIFFWAGFRLRNLTLFSFCFALATPLFWFGFVGAENLMLAGALRLIAAFQLRGSWARYLAALALVGLLPMFKLSAALIGLGAITGFLVERAIERGSKALREATVTVVVLAAVAAAVCFCVMPSVQSVLNYLRGSAEIIRGYSAAMSMAGSRMELVSASEAVAALVVLLWLQAASAPRVARFYVLLLAIPLFVSFKHGFVRQDGHVINFFCFVALALALVSLTVNLDKAGALRVVPILFFIIWQDNVSRGSVSNLVVNPSGEHAAKMVWGALRFDKLKERLDSSIEAFPKETRIEPELVDLIGDSPVASLSNNFANVAASRMRLKLYPVVQRYSAYTPYLDGLNAAWIRDQGPRFLVFDGKSIDGRDAWAETPAMWLEVYRWYDARLLGPRNLLLERRAGPRFTAFETIGRFRMAFIGELRLPVSSDAVFWTMKCGYSAWGQLQKLLFRVPSVSMSVHEASGFTRSARVIPEVLVSPVLGNYLPSTLSQFYAVFHTSVERGHSVDQVLFKSSGSWSYSPTCEVEILRPAR